jgi:hypothetical protein
MAEKLSESTWTTFTRKLKLDLDDAALVRALARFDKTSDDKPEPRAQALQGVVDEIGRQAALQARRKKELGDKTFGEIKDKLDALLSAAETLQKETAKAATQGRKGDDDEEDAPALLTSKLLALLREVRKGERVLQSLVATAGKDTVVMLSRGAISPARGALLKARMTNPAGLKFIRGECLFEDGAVTFVVQAPAAGLAMRIKAALLLQTGQQLKVRVRGENPDDVDQDDVDDEAPATTQSAAPRPPQAREPDPATAFNARLGELVARLRQAAPEIRAKASEAGLAARKRDFARAGRLLDEAERMLERARAGDSASGGRPEAMAAWAARRAAAIASLKSVAAKIAAARHPSSAKAILEIQAVIRNLTAEPATRQQVSELRHWLDTDDVVAEVCALDRDIRTPLLDALSGLQAQVA